MLRFARWVRSIVCVFLALLLAALFALTILLPTPRQPSLGALVAQDLEALNAEVDLHVLGTSQVQAARQLIALDPGLSEPLSREAADSLVETDPDLQEQLALAVSLSRARLLGHSQSFRVVKLVLTKTGSPPSSALGLDARLPLSMRVLVANDVASSKVAKSDISDRVQLVLRMASKRLTTKDLIDKTTDTVLDKPNANLIRAMAPLAATLASKERAQVANQIDTPAVISAFQGNTTAALEVAIGIARTAPVLNDLAVSINNPSQSLPLFAEARADDPSDPIIAANWAATSAIIDMDNANDANFATYTSLLGAGLQNATGSNDYQAVLDQMTVFESSLSPASLYYSMAGCDD